MSQYYRKVTRYDAENVKNIQQVNYGIGLTINKKIAVCLGGDIEFYSNSENGATFHFSFKAKSTQKNLS